MPMADAQQMEIECIVPQKMGDGQRPVYKNGETVQFQWKSTFPRFDLTITQVNVETQQRTNDRIYESEPNSTANFIWTAHNFDGLSQDDPFHLWIQSADGNDCDACRCRSTNFTVLDANVEPNTTTTSSATPTATSLLGSSTSSATANASNDHLSLGLGLGLGLGIPLLIIITVIATWMCVRRRRQRRSAPFDAQQGYNNSLLPQSSTAMPLSTTTYTQSSCLGHSSNASEKSPPPEMDSRNVPEMQADTTRYEAPQDAVRAELAGDEGNLAYDVKRQ